MRPDSATTRSTAATIDASSVRSRGRGRMPLPSASSRSARRAAAQTVHPPRARRSAVASPIPLLAPVTTTTLPLPAFAISVSARVLGALDDRLVRGEDDAGVLALVVELVEEGAHRVEPRAL